MNPTNLRVLTLTAYGEKPEDNMQVTLSAMCIKATFSKDTEVQGRPAKDVLIMFLDDSDPIEIIVNELDLMQLQSVVGTYGFLDS